MLIFCSNFSYVRDNYYDYEMVRRQITTVTMVRPASTVIMETPTSTQHINWVSYVYDILRKDYVPMELFRGTKLCMFFLFFSIFLFLCVHPNNSVNFLKHLGEGNCFGL